MSQLEYKISVHRVLTHDKPVLDATPTIIVGRIGELTPETTDRRFAPDVDNRLYISVAIQATSKVEHRFMLAVVVTLTIGFKGGGKMSVGVNDGHRRRWLGQP